MNLPTQIKEKLQYYNKAEGYQTVFNQFTIQFYLLKNFNN